MFILHTIWIDHQQQVSIIYIYIQLKSFYLHVAFFVKQFFTTTLKQVVSKLYPLSVHLWKPCNHFLNRCNIQNQQPLTYWNIASFYKKKRKNKTKLKEYHNNNNFIKIIKKNKANKTTTFSLNFYVPTTKKNVIKSKIKKT